MTHCRFFIEFVFESIPQTVLQTYIYHQLAKSHLAGEAAGRDQAGRGAAGWAHTVHRQGGHTQLTGRVERRAGAPTTRHAYHHHRPPACMPSRRAAPRTAATASAP